MQVQMRLFKRDTSLDVPAADDVTLAPIQCQEQVSMFLLQTEEAPKLGNPTHSHDNHQSFCRDETVRVGALPPSVGRLGSFGRSLNQAFWPCLRWHGAREREKRRPGSRAARVPRGGCFWVRSVRREGACNSGPRVCHTPCAAARV